MTNVDAKKIKTGVENLMAHVHAEESRSAKAIVELMMANAGISESDAFKVFALYRKVSLIKKIKKSHTWSVVHGKALEKEVIERAMAK